MDKTAATGSRVDSIDARLGRIEGDMSSIKTTLASLDAKMDITGIRSDVGKAHTDICKWIVTILAVVAAIYFGIQRLPIQTPVPVAAQAPADATGPGNQASSTEGRHP